MSFPTWNSDGSFNKITSTYFKDVVDLSGNLIIRNGTIKSPANTIEFDDIYSYINIPNNLHVLSVFKLDYNSIEYDVGLQCEKTDTLVSDVATLSPIVYDTQFKTTGFYWDAGLSTTVFNNNASFPNASISSTAINNTSFVSKSGAETIDGIKTFNSPPVMSGASITIATIPVTRVNGTAVTQTTQNQVISSTKTFSVVQNFTSNLRLDGSLLVGTSGGTVITNTQLQTIPNISTATTKLTNVSFTTPTTLITGTTETNVLKFNTSLNGMSPVTFSYLTNITSDVQTQINNISSVSLSANNIFTGLNKFTNNLQVEASLLVKTLTGSVTLSNDNLTRIQWLSNVTADIQTSLQTLQDLTSGFYRNATTGSYFFTSNLNTEGKFNTLEPYEIGYLTNMTENLQTAINNLKTKTDTTNTNLATTTTNANDALQRATEISYSATPTPQTNITNKIVLDEVVFNTDLNNITPTTFGYLANCSSDIQNQLNNKLTNIPGTIIQHISANLQTNFPTQFLLCNGQSVSRTTYANLFSYIGTTYGSVDANSFNVPDFTACFLRMTGSRTVNSVSYTPESVGTIQQDSMEAHVHATGLSGISYLRTGTSTGTGYFTGTIKPNQSAFPDFGGAVSSSHRTSTETKPLNHSVYFYITC